MTRPIQVLIIDDEQLARRLTREYLSKHADVEIIGECENGLAAVKDIDALHPDLIFLDIQMPKLSGFDVLELTGRNFGVVFTTAYDQYALKAFDLHAVDYLLKPFSQTRFDEALAQARKTLHQGSSALEQLIAHPAGKLERILIRDRNQVHVIPVASLDYVEAEDDYIRIFSDGKSFLKTQSLSELETQLDPKKFVRAHRSYIINIEKLQSIERHTKDSQAALLRSGKQIPISRTGYERIKAML